MTDSLGTDKDADQMELSTQTSTHFVQLSAPTEHSLFPNAKQLVVESNKAAKTSAIPPSPATAKSATTETINSSTQFQTFVPTCPISTM